MESHLGVGDSTDAEEVCLDCGGCGELCPCLDWIPRVWELAARAQISDPSSLFASTTSSICASTRSRLTMDGGSNNEMPGKRVRKPSTITKPQERSSTKEHGQFLDTQLMDAVGRRSSVPCPRVASTAGCALPSVHTLAVLQIQCVRVWIAFHGKETHLALCRGR